VAKNQGDIILMTLGAGDDIFSYLSELIDLGFEHRLGQLYQKQPGKRFKHCICL